MRFRPKRRVGSGYMRRRGLGRRSLRGRGFGSWLKGAFNSIGDFFTHNKIISSLAPIVGMALGPAGVPIGAGIGAVASQLGLGRRRRRRGRGIVKIRRHRRR